GMGHGDDQPITGAEIEQVRRLMGVQRLERGGPERRRVPGGGDDAVHPGPTGCF
ncbi:MAG: hypothetical protein H0T54_10140, partial [Geodermatophilaceae bacterium]|nr:hypothetical protein [Geodermatophilaceae bacterium]